MAKDRDHYGFGTVQASKNHYYVDPTVTEKKGIIHKIKKFFNKSEPDTYIKYKKIKKNSDEGKVVAGLIDKHGLDGRKDRWMDAKNVLKHNWGVGAAGAAGGGVLGGVLAHKMAEKSALEKGYVPGTYEHAKYVNKRKLAGVLVGGLAGAAGGIAAGHFGRSVGNKRSRLEEYRHLNFADDMKKAGHNVATGIRRWKF